MSSTTGAPLTYDFWGFPERYYRTVYPSPGAPELADRIAAMAPDDQPVHRDSERRLDHGAYVPLTVMYPEADIPTLQVSLPTLEPEALFGLGRRLAELREEGVMIIGSGFTTHGLPFLTDPSADAVAPGWSEGYGLFLNGEVDMALAYTTSPAYHMIAEQDDTKAAALFTEGHYMQVEVAAMTTATDTPDLAREFLAFLLTDPVQEVIPTTNWMYPAALPAAGLPPA